MSLNENDISDMLDLDFDDDQMSIPSGFEFSDQIDEDEIKNCLQEFDEHNFNAKDFCFDDIKLCHKSYAIISPFYFNVTV